MARPKEYDPDEAVEKAMAVFWARGYRDTSIRELIKQTGVNFHGLYGDFKNKRVLFLKSLDHYKTSIAAKVLDAVENAEPDKAGLAKVFSELLKFMETADGRIGCLMCNAAVEVAPTDEVVQKKVGRHLAMLAERFLALLERMEAAGNLSKKLDKKAVASFLANNIYTLGALMRAGSSKKHIKSHIDTMLLIVD